MITTRQTIKEYASLNGLFSPEFVEDYMGLKSDVDRINALLKQFTPQFGEGSPEGVATSNLNRTYFDTLNDTMYVNKDINTDTGWVLINV